MTHHLTARCLRLTALIALTPLFCSACATADAAPPKAAAESLADKISPADVGAESLLILHYHRPGGDYDGWNVWAWTDDGQGQAYPFDRKTPFGRAALIGVDHTPERFGFLIRRGQWEEKDIDRDRFVDNDADHTVEVWANSGDPKLYGDSKKIQLAPRITSAFLDGPSTLTVAATAPLKSRELKSATLTTIAGPLAIKQLKKSKHQAPGRLLYNVVLKKPIPPAAITGPMTLEVPGYDAVAVYARDVLDAPDFSALNAKLGPDHTPAATTFRTWSPVASAVELLLYEAGIAADPTRTIALEQKNTPGNVGVWLAVVEGDLHGIPYQYRFTSYGKQRTVADIHCFAAMPGSKFSVVVNLDQTDPDGWADDRSPPRPNPTDEVIYEIHVRDFSTTDPNCPPEFRGTYQGLLTPGTVVAGEPGGDAPATNVSTGIAHLKDLGVTAVHLLPIQDFGNERSNYNWGYWTSLFNVPESDYSTTPDDPANTIRQLKQVIQTLHDHDIRVILDVVYNHTSTSHESSPFDQTVPWYYFRTTPDGRLSNDAGVGNSVADERAMVRKYIIDSLKYWVNEYHIDGVRFDLLGTHHPETVRAVAEELYAIRPDLTIYGEPWTGGGPTHFPKGAQKNMGVAVFNDHLRNAIRGDLDGKATGFATGPGGDTSAIRDGVAGAIDDFTADPTESINYVSAHDNRTLWDKLVYTHPNASDDEKRAMHKLSIGIVLTSQGIPFLHGGSDLARTKNGEHNSYNKGDTINAFGWDRKAEYLDIHQYVAGLIKLRQAHPAFRMSTKMQVRQNLAFINSPQGVVAHTLNGRTLGDSWNTVLVAYNGQPTEQTLRLPGGRWTVVVNADTAGTTPLGEAQGQLKLPPYSMAVLHR